MTNVLVKLNVFVDFQKKVGYEYSMEIQIFNMFNYKNTVDFLLDWIIIKGKRKIAKIK